MRAALPPLVSIHDTNPSVARAFAAAFDGDHRVTVRCAHIFDDAPYAYGVVSPANSFGDMSGGIDLIYARRWPGLEARVQRRIRELCGPNGLPVGAAITVPTEDPRLPCLIVAPTMRTPEPVPWTRNAFLAFRAALQQAAIRGMNHILCPGLCTLTGRMDPEEAAAQMRDAWAEMVA